MEPVTQEKQQSGTEPFPDHDAIPDFHIVDQSPNLAAEKEKRKQKPRKKLRFQRIRGSLASELSDGNESLWIEPEKPIEQPKKWRMGVLEDEAIGGVPGTTTLFDDDHKYKQSLGASPSAFSLHLPSFHGNIRSGLATPRTPRSPVKKRARNGKTVLEPQPDDSHNDPLNWPIWKKTFVLLCLGLFSLLGGAMATVLANGLRDDSTTFTLSHMELGLTNGLFVVGLALGAILVTPVAIIYGKRIVYLVCAWALLATSIWIAFAPDYPNLLVARLVMGISLYPVFCLVPASITEIFHLHARGSIVGIYIFLLLAGMTAGPIASAIIIDSLDWRWIFWVACIAAGLILLLATLFVPESYWDRTLQPVHTRACIRSRSRANSGRSFRSYYSHCTCPIVTPPVDPHPGKLVTYERLTAAALEDRAQAHRERAVQRYYENSVTEPQASGAIISPPLASSTSFRTAHTSPEQMTVISPRPFESPRKAPSPLSRPQSAHISSSLNAHSSSSRPCRTTAHVDFASPTTSPPSRASPPRSRSNTASSGSTLVPSRPPRPDVYHPYRPPQSSAPRRRPLSTSSDSSTYSRSSSGSSSPSSSSPPSPLSRHSQHSHSSQHATSQRPHRFSNTSSSASSASYAPTLTHHSLPTTHQDDSRPSLRLDLEQILLDRASVGGFTDHTGRSGYQNGSYSYFRTFHGASCAGLTTPGIRSAHPGFGTGFGSGGGIGGGAVYTARQRERSRESWVKGMRVWNGRFVEEGFARVMARPAVLVGCFPGLVWAACVFGVSVGLLGVMPRAVHLLFAGEEKGRGYGDVEAAVMGTATLVGVLLGTVVVGPIMDLLGTVMARRNRGVFEPEFRLVGMVLAVLSSGAGIMGFGWVIEQNRGEVIVGAFMGLIGMGCAIGATASVTYVVDCVGAAVAEGMVILTVVTSLCYGLVLNVTFDEWIESRRPKEVFLVLGAIHAAVLSTTLPMYIFGKKARAWGARKTLFEQIA
ncbi:hypothetical protein CAC42_7447 [Sphaceloma murrayae]|uniref:Major facilitator superfamily (MFS) profile domain-containing protein n=1 Tax=Sphaceloma murrayae TaxID=2082308 RepID=A0A2K1QXG8_9PEZI|nr:hypothetical protein CAC42_7447 [Sphaceloma murrayae]